jgi:hypothetical protein
MILKEYFSATQQQTTKLSTLMLTAALSRPHTRLNLMRHGTYKPHGHRWHSSYLILALKRISTQHPTHPSTPNRCNSTPRIPQCRHQNLMITHGPSQPNANSSPCHYNTQQHHQFNKRSQQWQPKPRQLPPCQKPQPPANVDTIRNLRS